MKTKEISKIFKKYHNFLISAHVNPDPDALSSQLAVGMYLESLGKHVDFVNEEKAPEHYIFFRGAAKIKKYSEYRPSIPLEVMIVVDCGDMERIGSVQKFIGSQKVLINIDHHITNTYFGDINLIVPQASSTSEIIFDILARAKFHLNQEMAELLYIGIMTDTGSFRYSNTTAHTHKVVSQLMKFPIPVSTLYQELYENVALQDIKQFNIVAKAAEMLCKGEVICVTLPKILTRKFSEKFDLRDKIFKYFRAIKGVEVVVILSEQDKNKTRINFRSQGRVDVAQLASEFHGGGHRQASGCLIQSDFKKARKIILAKIQKALKMTKEV